MTADWVTDVRWSYDAVAEDYQRLLDGALDGLPVERAVLRLFAELVGDGPAVASPAVVDVGCGTGEVTHRLRDLGLVVFGVDVSPGMARLAHELHPDLSFVVAPLHSLPLASGCVDAVVCWYVLQHVPDAELDAALEELRRVLRPAGTVLVGFHAGTGSHVKTEGYGGHPMRVQLHRRRAADVAQRLERAGFAVIAEVETRPPPGARSGGAYVIAVADGGHPGGTGDDAP